MIWVDSVLSGSLYGGCWSKELGIFVIVGIDIIYTSSLQNRKPTNENIFNSEFNSIDEDGTWTFNALNTNSILLNGSSVSTLISDKQDKLVAGTNISIDATTHEISASGGGTALTGGTNITIESGEVSCDLTAGTNISIDALTSEISCDLIAGTNISIDALTSEISCDLTGSTNIDFTNGIISAVNLATTSQLENKQDKLTPITNISISTTGDISCDLVGSTNIDITGGVISALNLATTTQLGTKQDKLTPTTNISIDALTNEISCDLSAGTNISIDGTTKAISCDLSAGTNISIDGTTKAISCDLSAGTNISIDGTTKAISCDLSAGTNISIDASTKAISCDLTAGENIDITAGVISSTGGGTTLTGGTNITIDAGAVSCDLTAGTNISIDALTSAISCDLTAGENIDITAGVISSTGGGTTIDATTDLSCKSLTTTGNATIGGYLSHRNDYAHFYIEADQIMGDKFDTTYTIINYLNGSTIGNAISIGSTDGTTNNDLFIAQKSGYFKVNASFNYINTLNTERVSARTQLYKNNSYVDGNGEGYAYIRFGEGRNGSNVINSIIQLNINDRVSAVVSVRQGANTFFVNQTNHLNLVSASVVFEFIGE